MINIALLAGLYGAPYVAAYVASKHALVGLTRALDQRHKQVTCKLWDRDVAPDTPVRLSGDGKRRLIAPPWRPEGDSWDSSSS